ncbi:MAG: hypothetical protein AAGA21_15130 [Pseudomonadota bacterium]
MFFPIGNPIVDKINEVRDAVVPVTKPIGDAFGAAVDRARDVGNAVGEAGRSVVDKVESKAIGAAEAAGKVGLAALIDGERGLTDDEQELAKQYFGDSIDYDRVVINEYSVPATANEYFGNENPRPFAAGNTVHFPNGIDFSDPKQRSTFLHEMTHVWQFQSSKGASTTFEGLALTRQGNDAYRLDNVDIDPSNPESFHDLTIEQQAEIVRGHYLLSIGEPVHSRYRELAEHKDSPIGSDGKPQGFTAADLDPFIQEIQTFRPREGIGAEVDEFVDETAGDLLAGDLTGATLEVAEGGLEVGREVGEAAAGEVVDTAGDGVDFLENARDELTRRLFPTRPFGF